MSLSQESLQRLAELRRQIDTLDNQLIQLISARGKLAIEIGKVKAKEQADTYRPDREKEVLQRLRQQNPGPFPDEVLLAVYRELMSGSLALERPPRIAFLGPRGSFSHLAALGRFGSSVEYEPVADIAGVFQEVERRHADFAVVPIENSTGGGVIETLDAFVNTSTRVCAEILRKIQHNLLSRTALESIETLYSKPEAFTQCKRWLVETGLVQRCVPVASTAEAAQRASTEPHAAAIGSTLAAELYDLPILFTNIEDNPNNVTRFLVLGRECPRPTGDDKTTLLFTTAHRAGALVDVLEVFHAEQINFTMLTSRPSQRRNWEYCFFADAEGHLENPPMARAIEAAREFCLELSVLGSFPRAVEIV